MEVLKIAEEIERRINILEVGRKELEARAVAKAETSAQYEKELAKTILSLKNGADVVFEGQSCDKLPATLIEKVARGICWNDKMKSDLAESRYKNALVGMNSIEAELNGYQSIFRHLDNK